MLRIDHYALDFCNNKKKKKRKEKKNDKKNQQPSVAGFLKFCLNCV